MTRAYGPRVALSSAPGSLPKEFRIFRAGANPTTKGVYLFDDRAAALVIAEYSRQGVRLPIDLEHESLGPATRSDSGDARGWFRLALRAGELWAVDVEWTPDGARRLSERTQRYISPAFNHDREGRPVELINVALVTMPATHNAPALCARKESMSPTEEKLAQVLGTPSDDPIALAEALRAVIAGLEAPSDPLATAPDALAKLKSSPGWRNVHAYCQRNGITPQEFLSRAARQTTRLQTRGAR